ncbi:MAG: PhoH family protein [Ruminococcaceae bacterium]|nr:PhoH family protein [Oscillospiraceae bacterium]
MAEKILEGLTHEKVSAIFGSYDSNAEIIEEECSVSLFAGDGNIKIAGTDEAAVLKAYAVIESLSMLLDKTESLSEQNIRYAISSVNSENIQELSRLESDCICITSRGKPIKAKTMGQKKYVEAIAANTVVLGIGPAGTGKTFLAVAMAVNALRKKEVSRIVLTRPAVEAGEKLGFLPGDLQNKIDPYLRPLHDALYEMLGAEGYARNLEKGAIEIAPLAYMRGRTLDDSFIILDEAQNTTPEQMKMFLTRLGFGSKIVVTGDVTQIDLPDGHRSGLIEAARIISDVEGVSVHKLTDRDIVRHALVQKIILAYDRYEQQRKEKTKENEKQNIHQQ